MHDPILDYCQKRDAILRRLEKRCRLMVQVHPTVTVDGLRGGPVGNIVSHDDLESVANLIAQLDTLDQEPAHDSRHR